MRRVDVVTACPLVGPVGRSTHRVPKIEKFTVPLNSVSPQGR
ncbi:hypothetical protein SCAB_87161 [Streptomyces scabiei 87.22]|uniref:Uncharacterized protein n=1 Tax=Streptomyces scabiei (strain 87.22) TaxID=680198 RepID=C9Z4M6_STRSW|nr:hypothetical protein SCAB_87161 [Streptomyces scabiei 87.22]